MGGSSCLQSRTHSNTATILYDRNQIYDKQSSPSQPIDDAEVGK